MKQKLFFAIFLALGFNLTAQVTSEINGSFIQLPHNEVGNLGTPEFGTLIYDNVEKGTYVFTHDNWLRLNESPFIKSGSNAFFNTGNGVGNVNIGLSNGSARLFVRGSDTVDPLRVQVDNGTEFRVFANKAIVIGSNWGTPQPDALFIGATRTIVNDTLLMNGGRIKMSESGTMSFFTGTTEKVRIDANVNGDGRVTTDELEIVGGSDLAEYFDVSAALVEDIIPGKLVSVKGDNGSLALSTTKRDRKVVGVISGANGVKSGMFMGQKGSIANGDYPIALTGRTYVYATAENGPIEAGDFLTSSSKPGYAMKVKKMKKAQGAIVGKALTSLTDGEGFVLVLVNLQ